jgi:protoporphyrinogen oxidase
LVFHVPKRFSAGIVADLVRKVFPRRKRFPETFATVLESALGSTICREFYFPYARKLWGLDPNELSVTQARRRVSANSLGKMFHKIVSAIPGLKPPGAGRFFYPRQGYGQISQRLYEAAAAGGAEFQFGSKVTAIEREGNRVTAVRYVRNGQEHRIPTKHVWSTLPISLLTQCVSPALPSEVLQAAASITFRGMILIYLVLEQDQFTEYDAHYFPEEAVPISRLSEPKNYCAATEPRGRTVLCAELPSNPERPEWVMSDEQLGRSLAQWLGQVGLPVTVPILRVLTRRLRQAYPVYEIGYEDNLIAMDQCLQELQGLLTFGRQGLFAHDNTHHALYMAFAAVDCMRQDGIFDSECWREYRKLFETHVVED